jgi:hypothetical protein
MGVPLVVFRRLTEREDLVLTVDDGLVLADSGVAYAALERTENHGNRPEVLEAGFTMPKVKRIS